MSKQKNPKVMIFRVPGISNGRSEYILATECDGGKGVKTYTDILRLFCVFIPTQKVRFDKEGKPVINNQGETVKDPVTNHAWVLESDAHFTDFVAEINMDNVLLHRQVSPEESLYSDYTLQLEALANQRTEMEARKAAEKAAQQKVEELRNNRANRRAAATGNKPKAKKKKKTSTRRRAARV